MVLEFKIERNQIKKRKGYNFFKEVRSENYSAIEFRINRLRNNMKSTIRPYFADHKSIYFFFYFIENFIYQNITENLILYQILII